MGNYDIEDIVTESITVVNEYLKLEMAEEQLTKSAAKTNNRSINIATDTHKARMMKRNNECSMFESYPDILTVKDVQAALSVGRSTAYSLLSNGDIKHWTIGKSIKIPKQFLIDYVLGSCYNDGEAADSPSEKEV